MKRGHLPYILTSIVAVLLFGSCTKKYRSDTEALGLPDMNAVFEAYESTDSLESYAEFADELMEANTTLRSSELYVEAALLYHRAGQDNMAIDVLHSAIDRGMANPKILSKFPGLKHDPGSESWQLLETRLDSIRLRLQDISHFTIETESMTRFWNYFNRALKDSAHAKAILRDFVLQGPRELRDYYVVRYLNLENMYGQMINASPDYYSYLEKQFSPDSLAAMQNKTKAWMQNFRELYPPAVFPKVFVVPGILNSGGTTTEMGLFVGGDMYGRSDHMPTQGLNEWQKSVIMEFSDLPGLTLHELMHFEQNYNDTTNTDNVLRAILSEGICDFLVELSSGMPLDNANLVYMEDPANSERILKDLKHDLFGQDNSRWLYNGGDIEDRPHDLGYTLGYLISKSYYDGQEDKRKAVYELLNSDNLVTIVRESDYRDLVAEIQ